MRYCGAGGWKIYRTGEEGRGTINQCHQRYASVPSLFAINVRKNWSLARLVGLGSSWTRAESSAA
jgi:hypothetical protein